MADTIFSNGTVIVPAWLNDVNYHVYNETVRVTQFMSAAQLASPATVDCADAVQAAVDYCLDVARGGVTPLLEIPCLTKIESSINIDRPVNSQEAEFRIRGTGRLGGFCTTTSGLTFFTSTIAHTTAPVSEWVTFDNLMFQSDEASNENDVIDGDKFLRIKFHNCYFLRVRATNPTNYLQSWQFLQCQGRQWSDWFVSGKGMYDFHVHLCQFEEAVAGRGFSSFDPTFNTGTSGCSFHGNLFEGCQGPFLSLGTPQGVSISGNYGEDNTELFVDLSQGTVQGVSFTGNYVMSKAANKANVGFYEVVLGDCDGFLGGGNYTDGRLYDFTGDPSVATIGAGDVAAINLYRGSPTIVLSSNFPQTQTYTPTISSATNCSSVVVTVASYNKVGRQVVLQLKGTMSVTAGTTATSFVVTAPVNQASATDPAVGQAVLNSTGAGFILDNTGANPTEFFVNFPANQVLATGAQTWWATLTYIADE